MTKPYAVQKRILEAIKDAGPNGITEEELKNKFGRQNVDYNLPVLLGRRLITIIGGRFYYIGPKKSIEEAIKDLRAKHFHLRDPKIEEIAIEAGLPEEEIKIFLIDDGNGRRLSYSEPAGKDIEYCELFERIIIKNRRDIHQGGSGNNIYLSRTRITSNGSEKFTRVIVPSIKDPEEFGLIMKLPTYPKNLITKAHDYKNVLTFISDIIVSNLVDHIETLNQLEWFKSRIMVIDNKELFTPIIDALKSSGIFPKEYQMLETDRSFIQWRFGLHIGLESAEKSIRSGKLVYLNPWV
jgi:hypothetical protein